ncbi:MAG: right-handed parallel beta-helix repeat-containing protein [Candidatus Latescibacteria bacterium]|nr:right-handed parallel beta-helix repeat-containing protein [Candidatus Latescibacterota bacterium]
MHPLRIALATLLAIAVALPAHARTWRVNVAGTGDLPTIQAAVNACAQGDSILVAAGTYTWTNQNTPPNDLYAMIEFQEGRENITLVSEAGPHATILDAQLQGRVLVTYQLNYATIDGFTLTGGLAPALSGGLGGCTMLHVSHDTFKHCVFRENYATIGAVAWVGGLAEPSFIDCEFYDNVATYGGALYLVNTSTPITIERCTFHHNTAESGGGAIYMVHVRAYIEDSVFAFNQAPQGGAIYMRSMWETTISRSTFVRNTGAEAGSLYVLASPGIRLESSIVAYGGEGTPYFVSANSAVTFACNDTYRNPVSNDLPATGIDGGGNFSADPLLCGSVDSMNYTLGAASPCLPGNHPAGASCGQIGAFSVGCAPVSVRERSWGQIKAMYR